MRRATGWGALLATLIFSWAFAAEAPKTGIVKGTVTIGGKPTADAVISVEGVSPGSGISQPSAISSRSAVMDQRGMKFIPRVMAVVAGTTVDFPNNDNVWHNVFSTSEAKKFDLGLYPPKEKRSVLFDSPGVVRILCNVHPEMEAFLVVKEHAYFSTPDRRGIYQIGQVPLGRYRLEAWHPEFGTRAVPFALVREGEVLAIDIDLKKQR